LDKAQKRELVTALNEVFSDTGVIVVAHYSGLSVSEMTDFRSRAREAGAKVKVAKNSLIKRALEGTQVSGISDLFVGPTCITYSDDPVAAPKAAVNFAKDNEKLVILGGTMGATALDLNSVESLASLPSLDELRGTLVGLLQAPAGQIARLVNAPAGKLARVFSAKGQESEAA
jgi:large subunit ribosomal protein L10